MRRKASVSWRDTDKRMRRAAQLRQQGLSLRKIGHQLAVDESTIRADLRRWEALEVDRLLRDMGAGYESPDARIPQPYPARKTPNPPDRRMR